MAWCVRTYQSFGCDFRSRSGQWLNVFGGGAEHRTRGVRAPHLGIYQYRRFGCDYCVRGRRDARPYVA